MEITGETFMPLGDSSGTAVLRLHIISAGFSSYMNATASSKPEDGVEKLCTLQFAVIDTFVSNCALIRHRKSERKTIFRSWIVTI